MHSAILATAAFLVGGFLFAAAAQAQVATINVQPADLSTRVSTEPGAAASATISSGVVTLVAEKFSTEDGSSSEARITIDASDVGITTLSDLETMTWDANVVSGYIPHVDVIIEVDGEEDALVFEAAKVDPDVCETSAAYPTGSQNTLGRGTVEDGAYAWLNSGAAGPGCVLNTEAGFYTHTLSDWKAGPVAGDANGKTISGSTPVLRFELEVDPWISDSEAQVSNIVINGTSYHISIQDGIDEAANEALWNRCDEGQVNVNTASLEDLDGLTGVGPATAQNIIDARPYGVIDDLINASGIGSSALADIKSQGLACVDAHESITVSASAGTYVEDVTMVTDGITLQGAGSGNTTIKGVATDVQSNFPNANSSTNIDIQANDVTITGFTIQSPDAADGSYSSGMVLAGTDIEIFSNAFVISQAGTPPASNDSNTSVAIQTYSKTALPSSDVSGLHVHDNTFSGTPAKGYYGVYVNPTTATDAENPVVIEDNTFTGYIWRAITAERSHVTIDDNTITNTDSGETWGNTGIRVVDWGTEELVSISITNNTINGGNDLAIGIVLGDTDAPHTISNVSIQGNTVTANGTGVAVFVSADEITFSGNTISGNTAGVANTDTAVLNAEHNFWGAASGPSGEGGGTGDTVSTTIDFSPWLLTAGGTQFDETIVLTEAGQWALVSAPQLLSAAPTVVDDAAGAVALLGYVDGTFAAPTDGEKPVSAFYAHTANGGAVGFSYADVSTPSQTSKELAAGWSLIGTNNAADAADELSGIQNTSTDSGMVTLHVPDTYNQNKESGTYTLWGTDGNRDLNANPITELPEKNLSKYDGYWVFLNGARTYSKQTGS